MTMLAIVPASLVEALTKSSDLHRRQAPCEVGTSVIRAVWHGRDEHDAGHAWMCEMVAKTARRVEAALA